MPYLYQTKNGMQYSIAPIGAGRYCANKIMGGQVTPHGALFSGKRNAIAACETHSTQSAPVIHYPPDLFPSKQICKYKLS